MNVLLKLILTAFLVLLYSAGAHAVSISCDALTESKRSLGTALIGTPASVTPILQDDVDVGIADVGTYLEGECFSVLSKVTPGQGVRDTFRLFLNGDVSVAILGTVGMVPNPDRPGPRANAEASSVFSVGVRNSLSDPFQTVFTDTFSVGRFDLVEFFVPLFNVSSGAQVQFRYTDFTGSNGGRLAGDVEITVGEFVANTEAPEPRTLVLLGIGLLVIYLAKRK